MYELRKKIARYFFVVPGIFLILLDQAVKYKIRSGGGFYICNRGVAFGLPTDWALAILVIFVLLISALKIQETRNKIQTNFKFQYLITKGVFCNLKNWLLKFVCPPAGEEDILYLGDGLLRAGIIFILSGAISNIVDRLLYGCVVDYINLRVWPVFNLADVYITLGGIIVVADILRKNKL
jgi:lipoprotein signal peptidase